MGKDSRGKERGDCQECDCSDYEMPDKGNRCSYCDCAPTKHQLNSAGSKGTKAAAKGNTQSSKPASKDSSRANSQKKLDSSQSDKSEPKKAAAPPKKSTSDIKVEVAKVEVVSQEPIEEPKEKERARATPPVNNRNRARPPPRRRGEQPRDESPKDGGSGPMPPAGTKPRKKKSVAVKCHNLDQVMSSHLSDPNTRKRIDEMFSSFDDDASNELDRDECKDLTGYILQQCGLQPDIIPAFVYDEAFDKYDDDGGGTITLEEFREFLNAFLESK